MKRLIFTLFVLLSIMTAGAQEFVIVAAGNNGQPTSSYTLDEISSWGYAGNNFFINDENQTPLFSATGGELNFSSVELEEGEYFVTTFSNNQQAKFLIDPDLKINWKGGLTIQDKNRSKRFIIDVAPGLSIEAGTFGYVNPYILDASYQSPSLYFQICDKPYSIRASFSDAYTASIDKDYFYFSGPAGTIKFSRAEYKYYQISSVSRGTIYR